MGDFHLERKRTAHSLEGGSMKLVRNDGGGRDGFGRESLGELWLLKHLESAAQGGDDVALREGAADSLGMKLAQVERNAARNELQMFAIMAGRIAVLFNVRDIGRLAFEHGDRIKQPVRAAVELEHGAMLQVRRNEAMDGVEDFHE